MWSVESSLLCNSSTPSCSWPRPFLSYGCMQFLENFASTVKHNSKPSLSQNMTPMVLWTASWVLKKYIELGKLYVSISWTVASFLAELINPGSSPVMILSMKEFPSCWYQMKFWNEICIWLVFLRASTQWAETFQNFTNFNAITFPYESFHNCAVVIHVWIPWSISFLLWIIIRLHLSIYNFFAPNTVFFQAINIKLLRLSKTW